MNSDDSDEKLYEMVMNDIPKNPVNITGNILVCNRGCNLRWTLGEIDSFTIVKNKTHLLLKNLMNDGKPISSAFNKHLVTFNGGANSYADKNYVLSSISFNFPGVLYHGGTLPSGDIHLIFKAIDNSNLILVLIIPTEVDKGHGLSDMNKHDISFFTKIVKNMPSKHENNYADIKGVKDWSVDMLLPKKGTDSGKDHSFYSFVSPENSNICYIYFQHTVEITDTLLHSIVGNKGTASYNDYLKKAQERWTYPNPDNMVIFGNRDIKSETMDEMQKNLNSGNVKCNVHNDYTGAVKLGKDDIAVPITGKSENIVNIYIDDNSINESKKSKKKKNKKRDTKDENEDEDDLEEDEDDLEDEDEDEDNKKRGKKNNKKKYSKGKQLVLIGIGILCAIIIIGFVIGMYYFFKDRPGFMGNIVRGGITAFGIGKTISNSINNSVTNNEVTNNGVTNNGVTNNGVTNNGVTNNGVTNNGVTNNGVTNNGVTNNGVTNNDNNEALPFNFDSNDEFKNSRSNDSNKILSDAIETNLSAARLTERTVKKQ
jgi:hypothetical protein